MFCMNADMNVVVACVCTHVYEGIYAHIYIYNLINMYTYILYNLRLCMYNIFWWSCTFHPPMLMPSTPCGGRDHRMQLCVYLQTREREGTHSSCYIVYRSCRFSPALDNKTFLCVDAGKSCCT